MKHCVALVLLAACDHAGGDLTITVSPAPCGPDSGWESIAFRVDVRAAGVLEIEAVDRVDPRAKLDKLGTRELAYGLAMVDKDPIAKGSRREVKWAFGNRRSPPATSGCFVSDDEQRDLANVVAGDEMCSMEVEDVGNHGGSSRMFPSSCGAPDYVPHRLVRPAPIQANAGDYAWIAAWVWAPASARVEMHADGNSWSYLVDGTTTTPEASIYPAWTLRAHLSK